MTPFAQWLESRETAVINLSDFGDEPDSSVTLFYEIEEALTATLALQNELYVRQKVDEERLAWQREQAVVTEGRYRSEMAALANKLESSVSDVITPLLEDNIRRKGVEDFCSIIKRHLGSGRGDDIRISSPRALVPLVAEGMKRNGFDGVVEETDGPELHTLIGSTEIRTELENWVADLRALIAQ